MATIDAAEFVQVTIMGITGRVLLGPELFPACGGVAAARQRLQVADGCRVKLVADAEPLLDEHRLEGSVMLTAVFEQVLTAERRVECLRRLRSIRLADVVASFAAMPAEAREDLEVVCEALRSDTRCWEYVPESLRTTRAVVLALASQGGISSPGVGEEFRADKEIVLMSIQASSYCGASNCGCATSRRAASRMLQCASELLQSDAAVAVAALFKCRNAWQYVNPQLHDDVDFLAKIASFDRRLLENVRNSSLARRAIALSLVALDGLALRFVATPLCRDKSLVMSAVSQDGRALQWAADELRGDMDVVERAVTQNGIALQWASELLRLDERIALLAIGNDRLRLAPHSLRKRLRYPAAAASFVHYSIWYRRDFVKRAVAMCPRALELAASNLKSDKDVVMAAMSVKSRTGCSQALQFAGCDLKRDHSFIQCALKSGNPKRRILKCLEKDTRLRLAAAGQLVTCQSRVACINKSRSKVVAGD